MRIGTTVIIHSDIPTTPGVYELRSFSASKNPGDSLMDDYNSPIMAELHTNGRWVILSKGPDREFGTNDDVKSLASFSQDEFKRLKELYDQESKTHDDKPQSK